MLSKFQNLEMKKKVTIMSVVIVIVLTISTAGIIKHNNVENIKEAKAGNTPKQVSEISTTTEVTTEQTTEATTVATTAPTTVKTTTPKTTTTRAHTAAATTKRQATIPQTTAPAQPAKQYESVPVGTVSFLPDDEHIAKYGVGNWCGVRCYWYWGLSDDGNYTPMWKFATEGSTTAAYQYAYKCYPHPEVQGVYGEKYDIRQVSVYMG